MGFWFVEVRSKEWEYLGQVVIPNSDKMRQEEAKTATKEAIRRAGYHVYSEAMSAFDKAYAYYCPDPWKYGLMGTYLAVLKRRLK